MKQLQELSQAKVKALLGVSDALAKLNYQRYASFFCCICSCSFGANRSPRKSHLYDVDIACRFQSFEMIADGKQGATLQPSATHKQAVLSFNGPAYLGTQLLRSKR